MDGPVRIQGRGYGEGVFQAGLGTPLVLISLWALSLGVGARKPLFVDAFFAVLALAGTIMIATGFQALRQRTVEVDESGVRVKLGGHVDWQATWGEVEAIGTRAAVGELGDVCVFVRTQSDEYTLTVGANFGPRRHLMGAFKAMATQAPAGVRVEDDFGWITFGRPPVDGGKFPDSPHFSVWHPSFGFKKGIDEARLEIVALLMVIPIMGVVGGMESGLSGAVEMMVVAGVLMAVVMAVTGAWVFAASAKAFRFDRNGIEIRYPLGAVRVRWNEVTVCRADRSAPAVYVGKGPPRIRTMGPTPLYACEEVRADLIAAFEAAHYWTKEARDERPLQVASTT